MMKNLISILLTGLAVFVTAYILPGVDVDSFWSAVLVAIVIIILNYTIKPLLVLFTLPATVLTMGLFMFVVNAMVILIADWLMDSFKVKNFWLALLFGIILSIVNSILQKLTKEDEKKTRLFDQYGNEIK